jgi:hypothetical protein
MGKGSKKESGSIKAELNYGLKGQFKVDIYDKNENFVSTTDWFSNYIPLSGLEHPVKYPFAACFEALSLGVNSAANSSATTGLHTPITIQNSQDDLKIPEYMHEKYYESGDSERAGSCGTHFDCAGPIMFRGWRVPTGTGFALATKTINEFAVFPGTSGIKNEEANHGESPWNHGACPCFSRVVKQVAIQKDQYAIVNYRLQIKMEHTGASIFAPETFNVDGVHPDSPAVLTGLWGNLSGKFKQVAPAISYVTERGKTKKPKWGDYLEPACTGYGKSYWYLSPDIYQFIADKTGGPIKTGESYDEALAGYYCSHIMQKDGTFPEKIPANHFPTSNIRRGKSNASAGSQGGGVSLIPSTGDYFINQSINWSTGLFNVDDGHITKEPYDTSQRGGADRKRKQRIKAFWAANQGRGPEYRFKSMVFGGLEPDADPSADAEIFPSIDFLFSDNSGRYPSFRKDIGVTGAFLSHPGEGYIAPTLWDFETTDHGKRRASVSNDQNLTKGNAPVPNSGVASRLSGVGSIQVDDGFGNISTEWKGYYNELKVYVTGENYTGVPNVIPPTNWPTQEKAGHNPNTNYYDLSGLRQCISGYVSFSGATGYGIYTGSLYPSRADYVAPTVIIESGTGIIRNDPDSIVTGTGTALLGLYAHPQHGQVWGVTGIDFGTGGRGQYKGTGYAFSMDHDDMHDLHANPSGIPAISFTGGSVSGGVNASGDLVLTQNARASGHVETGENRMLKDQYVGTAENWVTQYSNIGEYPYKDNLNVLNLFLELQWSGHDSG